MPLQPVPALLLPPEHFGRGQPFIAATDGLAQGLLVVGEDGRLFPAARHRDVELLAIRGRQRRLRLADQHLVHRLALRGMAGHHIAIGDMAEIPADGPAVIQDDVASGGEALHREQRPVVQAVPAIRRLPIGRDPQPVAGGKPHAGRPVRLEARRLVERQRPGPHLQPLAGLESLRVLMELEHVAGQVAVRLSPLRFRQVQRHVGEELALLPSFPLAASSPRMTAVIRCPSLCVGDTTRARFSDPSAFLSAEAARYASASRR